ncbi:ganglioside-induced differentiation-associated protein 2-like [Chenopodium quinoa]|uniref:CRAL-TRIO domain-containing protein n=1 Tax=Chenopodium quinoa TaxID=63459 RepID=A0A803N5H4_CHEQI|nr:ganglioside-induced differentiation-associated protein 2-like [Chenopodium quinoa]
MENSTASEEDDFSVFVLASDLGVDARPFLDSSENPSETWHDCPSYFADEDFSDLEARDFFRLQGSDKSGNRIFRIVGKYFPAPVIDSERLKKYVFYKIYTELPEGPFGIVYMHTTVQKEDNSPGMTILRWIYEDLPAEIKDRLQVVYFLHPGLRSRLAFATLGRFFLSGNLYWKIKYVSRLQYLWDDIKKSEVEIPEFVKGHDDVLENRPLTDYGIEPDPLKLTEVPSMSLSLGRYDYEERWASREQRMY